jgi:hypothetical protein
MSWCTGQADCAATETCTSLVPAVFLGNVEYGVCWDQFWCGFG